MRTGETTPPSLFSRLRDGHDSSAWRELDERYRELILRYAQGRGLQSADAEDVRQLVMLQLTRCIDRFAYQPSRGTFRSYLGAMVRHAISRQRAARHRTAEVFDVELLDRIVTESDDEWDRQWRQHHYRLAMAHVRTTSSPQTMAIFEALLADEPVADIAARQGTTAANIYKVKQRMRERLRERIEEQLRDERP